MSWPKQEKDVISSTQHKYKLVIMIAFQKSSFIASFMKEIEMFNDHISGTETKWKKKLIAHYITTFEQIALISNDWKANAINSSRSLRKPIYNIS